MKKHIPNILTFLNLTAGFLAILLILQPHHPNKVFIISVLIFAGGIIDFFDGYLARKLGVASDFGKNLDSFADIVTFGVAPVVFANYISNYPIFTIIAGLVFMLAASFRLARFNLHAQTDHFHGLPITAAGIILTATTPHIPALATAILMLALSLAMISKKQVKRL